MLALLQHVIDAPRIHVEVGRDPVLEFAFAGALPNLDSVIERQVAGGLARVGHNDILMFGCHRRLDRERRVGDSYL